MMKLIKCSLCNLRRCGSYFKKGCDICMDCRGAGGDSAIRQREAANGAGVNISGMNFKQIGGLGKELLRKAAFKSHLFHK